MPQASGIMPGREASQRPRLLEPPEGATVYDTVPLAGRKRQHPDQSDDENDMPTQVDSATKRTLVQQTIGEYDLGNVNDIVQNDQTHETLSKEKETKKAKVNVTITKNEIRNGSNGLEFKHDDVWYPAIYHHEFVRLFHKDQLYGPKYTHTRKTGPEGEYDKTAYLAEQKDWGKHRDHRPAILFEFKKPEQAYLATVPKWLTCLKGDIPRIIIDVINNKPLRSFSQIPITVSTVIEGWLQEAWFRQDPALQVEDLIQRMPYTAKHNVYKDRRIINRLVRRRELFRDEGRCLSWKKSTWQTKWDLYLIDQMEKNPSASNPNSTRHLEDLTPNEKRVMKDLTYASGKHLPKGKKRALQGEKRAQKDRETKERLALHPAKRIKTILNKSNSGDLNAEQTTPNEETSRPTQTQNAGNTSTVQPEQYHSPASVADRSGPMSHPNIQSTCHPRTTCSSNHEQWHTELSELPGGYHGYPEPETDPPEVGYPMASWTSGNLLNAHPAQHAAANPQHWMQPPYQHRINQAALPNRADDQHIHPSQIQYEHSVYRDNLGQLRGPVNRTSTSSGGMRSLLSQPPRLAPKSDLLNTEPRSYSNPTGPYLSNNSNTGDFKCRHSTNDDLGQLQHYLTQEPQTSFTQQHIDATYVDEFGDFWGEINHGSNVDGYQTYHPAPYFNPLQPSSTAGYRMMTDEIYQQVNYPHAKSCGTAETGRTSSKKRRAEDDEGDLLSPSRKSRKLR